MKKEECPTRRNIYDWILETVSFLGLICSCIPLFFYNKMDKDDLFPIHYNLHGIADGWGDRKFLLVFIIIAITLYFYLTFSEKLFKRFPYPVKVNEENLAEIYRLGIRLRRHIKSFLMLIFAYMCNSFLCFALFEDDNQPNRLILTWLLGGLIAIIVIFYMMMRMLK